MCSDPTKDRYLYMYCFSDRFVPGTSFNYVVLELVKLVQCALALFGMFDGSPEERNGLLCDLTAEGILRWTDEVGEPLLSLEVRRRIYISCVILCACLAYGACRRSKCCLRAAEPRCHNAKQA
jgi:hypothetical protein